MRHPEPLVGVEKVCPVCGKIFMYYTAGGWVYQRSGRLKTYTFCSWSCLRAFDRTRSSTKIESRERIIQAIQDGLNDKEIATLLDVDKTRVAYWRKKLEGEKTDEIHETGGSVSGKAESSDSGEGNVG